MILTFVVFFLGVVLGGVAVWIRERWLDYLEDMKLGEFQDPEAGMFGKIHKH